MNLENNIKKAQTIIPVVFLFSFIRSVVFADEKLLGYDFYNQKSLFDISNALFFILVFLYSLFIAFLVFNVYNKHGNKYWLPCLLMIVDPVFIIEQRHVANLIIRVVWVLYLNVLLSDKAAIKNSFQLLFLAISSVISPKVTFCYIPMVALTEFIPGINNSSRTKKRKLLFQILSVFVTVVGIIVNKVLYANVSEFQKICDFLNQSSYDEKDGFIGVLLLSIPSLIIGICFFCVFMKNYKQTRKKDPKKKRKNKTESLIDIILISFELLLVISIFGGYKTLSIVSLFFPTVVLLLIFSKDELAEHSLSYIDGLIFKHPVASVGICGITYYICLRFYLWQFGAASIISSFFVWGG